MIKLHLLNASGRFTAYQESIEAIFTQAIQQVSTLLPVSDVDVVFCFDPESVIPEFGLGGYSPSGDRVIIPADPENPNFAQRLETEFLPLLGHELHHSMRWRTVGYGRTLLEALVSEGLACHFETELLPGVVPFYASVLSQEEIAVLLAKATQSFSDDTYSHGAWFFGQTDEIPFYADYTLGFELVNRYIQEQGKKASSLYNEPAEQFQIVI